MALELWLMIIIFIIGVSIILRLVKKAFKAAGLILLLFLLINFVFTITVVRDFIDIKNTWFSEPRIYAFEDNNDIKAAVSFTFPDQTGTPDLTLAKAEDLEGYSAAFNADDLESIKGNNHRLFLMNRTFVEKMVVPELDVGDSIITREQSLEILTGDNGFELFANLLTGQNASSLTEEQRQTLYESLRIEEESQFRSMYLMMSVVQGMFSGGPSGLLDSIEQFKKGSLIIHPETMFFRSFRIFPVSFLRSIAGRAKEKASDLAGNVAADVKEAI